MPNGAHEGRPVEDSYRYDEPTPDGTDESVTAKFVARRDRALATVVLSIDPSLLYLLGDPQDPVVVWKKLARQFEKKTWATRLDLCRKLHSLRLKDGESAQEHIRVLTELFDALIVLLGKLYLRMITWFIFWQACQNPTVCW